MLILVTDQKKINALYKEFERKLKIVFPTAKPEAYIGHKGGPTDSAVRAAADASFWTCARSIDWNPFGLADNWAMVVQINFASPEGSKRAIGVFAEDENGQPFVLHRGNIGGGRPGIGKTVLMAQSQSPRE